MEAIRTTLNSAQLAAIIDLPLTLRDREVEVVIRPSQAPPIPKKTDDDESSIGSFMGCLSEYANPDLREQEKGAWERAAVEKYLEKKKDGRF